MRFRNTIFLGIIVAFITSGDLTAKQLTVRNGHSMVYDSKDRRTILFGGADEKKVYGDLWVLKKKRWKPIGVAGPLPRTFASMVYDENEKRILLFGGNSVLFGSEANSAKFFGDTWEYKNKKWRKLRVRNSPTGRAAAAIAYDGNHRRIVLFGGYRSENDKNVSFGDTWEFKNGEWKKISEIGPSPRIAARMVYDSDLKRIVLFGGSTSNQDYGINTGETWVLIDNVWKKLDIEQPANIFDSTMVYQKRSKSILRFGGWNGNERTSNSWVFQGNTWQMITAESKPLARNHSTMVYDSKKKRAILFGGHNGDEIFGDLWIFKNGKWYKQFEHNPLRRIDNGH